jgi:hypothetical protein
MLIVGSGWNGGFLFIWLMKNHWRHTEKGHPNVHISINNNLDLLISLLINEKFYESWKKHILYLSVFMCDSVCFCPSVCFYNYYFSTHKIKNQFSNTKHFYFYLNNLTLFSVGYFSHQSVYTKRNHHKIKMHLFAMAQKWPFFSS